MPNRYLLYYYEPNRATQRFGREVLRLHLADWAVQQFGLLTLTDLPPSPDNGAYRTAVRTAHTRSVEALLYLFEAEAEQYAPADLHDTAKRLYYLLTELPKSDLRTRTAARLRVLARRYADTALGEALRAGYRVCR